MIEIISIIVLILAGIVWFIESGRSAGKDKERLKQYQQIEEDEYAAKIARNKLDSDPDYARRLRDKYTRK